MSAISLGDVYHATLRNLLGNRCFTRVLIAIGSNTAKIKTTADAQYCIDGVMYLKAATDDLFVHTDLEVQPVSTTRYYALCLDASGNPFILKGTATGMPDIPTTYCLVGCAKVVTDSTHTFTPATTAHNAAGITTTYWSLSCNTTTGAPA